MSPPPVQCFEDVYGESEDELSKPNEVSNTLLNAKVLDNIDAKFKELLISKPGGPELIKLIEDLGTRY